MYCLFSISKIQSVKFSQKPVSLLKYQNQFCVFQVFLILNTFLAFSISEIGIFIVAFFQEIFNFSQFSQYKFISIIQKVSNVTLSIELSSLDTNALVKDSLKVSFAKTSSLLKLVNSTSIFQVYFLFVHSTITQLSGNITSAPSGNLT
jgi:hypothetical protein